MDEIKIKLGDWYRFSHGSTNGIGREVINNDTTGTKTIFCKSTLAPGFTYTDIGIGLLLRTGIHLLKKLEGEHDYLINYEMGFSSCGVSLLIGTANLSRTIAYSPEKTETCQYELRGIYCNIAPQNEKPEKPILPKECSASTYRLSVANYGSISEYSGSSNFMMKTESEIMSIILANCSNKYNVLTFNGGKAEEKMRKMFPNHFCKSIRSRSSSKNISICQIPLTRIEALKKKYKI